MASKYKIVPSNDEYQSVELERSTEKFHDSRHSSSDSLGSTLLEEEQSTHTPRGLLQSKWMFLVHGVLLFISLSMFTLSIFTRSSTLKHVQDFSAWSPAATAVEYQNVHFNVSMGTASPFMGKGPEVDKAWDFISSDMGDTMVSEAELIELKMPKTSLKVKDPKTGAEGYRVGLEVFHQLHCLNLLRQVTYRDHYMKYTGDVGSTTQKDLLMHTDHCIEILRLNLQCNADIGVFTLYLEPNDPLPWPELNTKHTCRNFDRIREWAVENSVGSMERGV